MYFCDSSSEAEPRIVGHLEINSQHSVQRLAECRYAKYMLDGNITLNLHIVKMIEKLRGKDWLQSNENY